MIDDSTRHRDLVLARDYIEFAIDHGEHAPRHYTVGRGHLASEQVQLEHENHAGADVRLGRTHGKDTLTLLMRKTNTSAQSLLD